ncbi:hypothetical protein SIL04_05080 [Bacillus cereus group sp. BfR-BA-00331]|uniref:hypothetical protein n=1 Tax=Bacillus cereus group TaxID=86661 RepID=UPI0007721BD3|nr:MULTISPECIES: hypothetical protein [Bacillus cereus group]MCC2432845.1 hypothetical protein [Bacillus paranthracis]MDX5956970.1 hypothetical protein [Bacillus cereus group sp. BfR-BA-00331]
MCAKWKFTADYTQFETLERNIMKLPNAAEKIINADLKDKIAPVMKKSILGLVPVSDRKKQHAKSFQAIDSDTKKNLTLRLRPKQKYRYLVFPDLAVGTSHKKTPQDFMDRGVEKEINYSVEELNKSLIEEINKTLGGN